MTTASPVSLVEVTRGSLVESQHWGSIAVVDVSGTVVAQVGNPTTKTFFRSAAKPLQAIALIASGAADHFKLTSREVAVCIGSHGGEPIHVEAVRSILTKIGLDESALQCGLHSPFDEATARTLRVRNEQPSVLHNNCSGKHAGMLALARFNNLSIADYLAPTHPVQQKIQETIAQFSGIPAGEIVVAIDGCSAPVFGLPLQAMAWSYARLMASDHVESKLSLLEQVPAQRVTEAMIQYPEMVGGTQGRLDTELIRLAGGQMIAKVGAEGVQLLGMRPSMQYPRGLGVAIKIEDGDTRRARDPVVIETLRQLGVLDDAQLAQCSVKNHSILRNHRQIEVGEIRSNFNLKTV